MMEINMYDQLSIPFKIDDVYHGFAECNGMLHIHEEGFIFEYETKDAIFNIIKSGIKRIKLRFTDIRNIEFKKKFFSTKLIITSYRLDIISQIPGYKNNRLELIIHKQDRDEARELTMRANLFIAEARLKSIEGNERNG